MLKPLHDRVLIMPIEHQTETSFGLIVSNGVTNEGRVIAVGLNVKDVKAGDTVRYSNAVRMDSYLLCRELDVLCVVEADIKPDLHVV